MLEGLIGIGFLVLVNIVAMAFSYGKLSQKVSDICRRLNDVSHRIEKLENGRYSP